MSHLIFNRLILSCAIFALCACSATQSKQPEVIVEPKSESVQTYNPDNSDIFSNQNVIVYSLDKPIESNKRSFAPHRSVIENTTAGGFTVFDQSVIVYSLDGISTKPDYLPDYSVPKYAQELSVNEVETSGIIPEMPADMMPIQEGYTPNAPMISEKLDGGFAVSPMATEPLPVMNVPARRSRPLLTSYE